MDVCRVFKRFISWPDCVAHQFLVLHISASLWPGLDCCAAGRVLSSNSNGDKGYSLQFYSIEHEPAHKTNGLVLLHADLLGAVAHHSWHLNSMSEERLDPTFQVSEHQY